MTKLNTSIDNIIEQRVKMDTTPMIPAVFLILSCTAYCLFSSASFATFCACISAIWAAAAAVRLPTISSTSVWV